MKISNFIKTIKKGISIFKISPKKFIIRPKKDQSLFDGLIFIF